VTPSEHLWALATERANAPEHMRELFALAIDRATWDVADKINYDVGRSASFNYGLHGYWSASPHGFYAEALHKYIQLKLCLHRIRRRIMRHEEWNEQADIPRPLQNATFSYGVRLSEEEASIRQRIKAARAAKGDAIWGDLKPEGR
jgi:hypothetical protein